MKVEELHEEINLKLTYIEQIVQELVSLQTDLAERDPTLREKTAGASFLGQFYNGIENILKRTSRFHGVPLPTGEAWHKNLFERFCVPSYESLPVLFDKSLESDLASYRQFRHVTLHAYGFQHSSQGVPH